MPRDERFTVPDAKGGHRLDQILAALPSVGSRGKARKVLTSGKVHVDGAAVDDTHAGRMLREGTVVEVRWNQPGTAQDRNPSRKQLRDAGVRILHEDAVLLALDKPPGLLTDAATYAQRREEDTLTVRARAWCGRGDVWPVHRIDRDTSGVVLFAKGAAARAHLKAQWEGEKPRRIYLACLVGELADESGGWEHPMRWDHKKRLQVPCSPEDEGAVVGRSHFRVTRRLSGATVVEVELDTGRRNQIRLSAKLAGHPLVGERQYGRGADRSLPKLSRQALHALELTVRHPDTEQPLTLRAPVPGDLVSWMRAARQAR